MRLLLRDAQLTFGIAILGAPLLGTSLAVWSVYVPAESAARSVVATSALEVCLPMFMAVVAARALARDMGRGVVEYIALRGRGYRVRLAARMAILTVAWAVAVVPVVLTSAPNDRGDLVLANAGGSAVLAMASLLAAAVARSELLGAVLAAAWWIGSLAYGAALPQTLPWTALHLSARTVGMSDWFSIKEMQLLLASTLAVIALLATPRLVRGAVISQP